MGKLILFCNRLAALVVLAAGPTGWAAVNWTGAGGTSWGAGGSWSNGSGPSSADIASFSDTGASMLPNDITSRVDADRGDEKHVAGRS